MGDFVLDWDVVYLVGLLCVDGFGLGELVWVELEFV